MGCQSRRTMASLTQRRPIPSTRESMSKTAKPIDPQFPKIGREAAANPKTVKTAESPAAKTVKSCLNRKESILTSEAIKGYSRQSSQTNREKQPNKPAGTRGTLWPTYTSFANSRRKINQSCTITSNQIDKLGCRMR